MNILALDLARQVGFAAWQDDSNRMNHLSSGTKSFAPLRGQGVEALFGKWQIWLDDQLERTDTDLVAYELIDWKILNKDWRAMYLGMTAIIRGTCFNHNVESRGYTVRDIKMAATGKAKAEKPEMMRTARAMWPEQTIIDDNQADALWVLYVAMKSKGVEVRKHPEMLL